MKTVLDFPQDFPCHLAFSVFNLIITRQILELVQLKIFMLHACIPTYLQNISSAHGICKQENNDLEKKKQENKW